MTSKTPNYDAKVKAILDATQPDERVCALTGEKWKMDEEEVGWYKKFNVPPSTLHPDTRSYIMKCFWLTFSWWWNKHWKTGERLLTYVHPATGIRVLPDIEWYEEDFTSEGRDMDRARPFFDQLRELQLSVPLLAHRNEKTPHNSITMFSHGDIDSYFVMFCRSRNTFFSDGLMDGEDSSDVTLGGSVKSSYNVTDGVRLYDCRYVRSCRDCVKTSFAFDCRNCEYVFGAWNKRNRKYLWWNEALSQGEWEKRRERENLSCRDTVNRHLERLYKAICSEVVWPENFNEHAVDSSGEYLRDVNNIRYGNCCFDGSRDCYRTSFAYEGSYDCAMCESVIDANNCFGCTNAVQSAFLRFCDNCQSSQNLEYCLQCFNCENCFGCIGLNRKKFCILNRQYVEEEYWRELDRIKTWMLEEGWYGRPFPASMGINPFPQSGAVVWAGASEEIGGIIGAPDFPADTQGALGHKPDTKERALDVEAIPNCIMDVGEDLVGQPYYDKKADRYFALIKPEIIFYKKHGIPVPDRHFMDRLNDLGRELNIGTMHDGACANCDRRILITRNPTFKERTIYCKPCYLQYLEKHG